MPPLSSLPVVLVGLPGAGKTTVGRNLAKSRNLRFLDTDQLIESQIGCTIREFFETHGESAFREIESSTISDLIGSTDCLISTGGGAVISSENRQKLQQHFNCIYLRATPEDLYRRLRHDKKRPLLQVADPLQAIRHLFAVRDPLYLEVAKVVVDTGRPSVGALVAVIERELQLQIQDTCPDAVR